MKTTFAQPESLTWRIVFSAALPAIILALAATTADAKMYRWVDKDGNVHYSDKVPPTEVDQARTQLNERGIAVEQVERAKTPEELARDKELEEMRAEQQRLIEKQKAEDRVLLATFRSEEDIHLARDGKVTAVGVMIQILRNNIENAKSRLEDLQMMAADQERRGEKVSKATLDEIEGKRNQIKDSYASILQREQEQEEIRKKFQYDVERFRTLKNLRPREQDESAEDSGEGTLLETVVMCEDEPTCGALWKRAEGYLKAHATTPLQLLGKSILMTKAPLKDDDISITISRITDKEDAGVRLFMDLQCKNSPLGKELCRSDKVRNIRADFRRTLTAGTEAETGTGAEAETGTEAEAEAEAETGTETEAGTGTEADTNAE